ncbi:Glycerol-3-phosphate dehydrogenase (NAD(P)+) [alpha proteobacterium BAL199]|jgi:glycerol-3-phosphate dehydrogenase (NAD(P)+)|nr:Glycerol-3-phosphate dehydrogenase (NAD(P)+) [alpha proteobacterium BAL199]
MSMGADIAILGGGAWGRALAVLAQRAGCTAVLWARQPRNVSFSDARIAVTGDLAAVRAPIVLLAVPAKAVRAVAAAWATTGGSGVRVSCAKGFDPASGRMLADVLAADAPAGPVAVLSGPTFAAEAVRGVPTAATVACADQAVADRVAAVLGSPTFRLYTTTDVIGVEAAGAFKNVLAIACGIADGMALGDNARAALITRGLAELARLAAGLGGRAETVMGLAGLGDVVLTCTSGQSRNYAFGHRLGEGRSIDEALAASAGVVEGAVTAASLLARGRSLGLDLPVTEAVDAVLNRGADLKATAMGLLARPSRGAETA